MFLLDSPLARCSLLDNACQLGMGMDCWHFDPWDRNNPCHTGPLAQSVPHHHSSILVCNQYSLLASPARYHLNMFLMDTGKDERFSKYNNGLEGIESPHHLLNVMGNSNWVCKVLLLLSWQFHYRSLHQCNSSIHALPEDPLLDCMCLLGNQLACQHLKHKNGFLAHCMYTSQLLLKNQFEGHAALTQYTRNVTAMTTYYNTDDPLLWNGYSSQTQFPKSIKGNLGVYSHVNSQWLRLFNYPSGRSLLLFWTNSA